MDGYTIARIKREHESAGGCFFIPANIKPCNGRVESEVIQGRGGIYFIMGRDSVGPGGVVESRLYRLHAFRPHNPGRIDTIGNGRFYLDSLATARDAARLLANETVYTGD